jgi:hypothetical protein
MRRLCLVVLMLNTLTFGKDTHSDHRDYVPDKKTAERIAEAVLEAQFGEEQIKTQGPGCCAGPRLHIIRFEPNLCKRPLLCLLELRFTSEPFRFAKA